MQEIPFKADDIGGVMNTKDSQYILHVKMHSYIKPEKNITNKYKH